MMFSTMQKAIGLQQPLLIDRTLYMPGHCFAPYTLLNAGTILSAALPASPRAASLRGFSASFSSSSTSL